MPQPRSTAHWLTRSNSLEVSSSPAEPASVHGSGIDRPEVLTEPGPGTHKEKRRPGRILAFLARLRSR